MSLLVLESTGVAQDATTLSPTMHGSSLISTTLSFDDLSKIILGILRERLLL